LFAAIAAFNRASGKAVATEGVAPEGSRWLRVARREMLR
jgi:hypothetical protein